LQSFLKNVAGLASITLNYGGDAQRLSDVL